MLFHSNIYSLEKLFSMSFEISQNDLANKEIYNIPFYQREYVWTSKESQKLLEDVLNAYKSDSPRYFLGGIVLNAESITSEIDKLKYIDIVDGQQRSITLSIILATLYNFLQHNKQYFIETSGLDEGNLNAFYRDTFSPLINLIVKHKTTLREGTISFFKIFPNELIRNPYENFIDHLILDENGEFNRIEDYEFQATIENKKTSENILEVASESYHFFEEHLKDIDVLEKFVPFLLEKVLLVVTITDNLKTAFQIFETLNDRGVGLSPNDLIKSFLMKNLTNDYKEASGLWDKFINNLKNDKGNFIIKPLEFFEQLYFSEGIIVPQDNLFEYFENTYSVVNNINNDINIKKFLEKLISLSEYYIENQTKYNTLVRLNFDNAQSTLFALYKIKTKGAKMKKFVKQLERIAIVYFFNNQSKKVKNDLATLNEIIFNGLKDISSSNFDRTIAKTYKTFIKKVNSYIKDERSTNFENSVVNMNIPKSGKRYLQVKYALAIMSHKLYGANYDISSPETTIEHLMPLDKPNTGYESIDTKDYQIFNKRIGNLSIMNKDLNQELSNKNFKEKLEIIKEQGRSDYLIYSLFDSSYTSTEAPYGNYKKAFNYERQNADKDMWNIDEINHRSQQLAKLMKYIWVDGHI